VIMGASAYTAAQLNAAAIKIASGLRPEKRVFMREIPSM
jgi:hypothetical protein